MQEHPRSSQNLAKPEIGHEKELETEKQILPLPLWCRAIMVAASSATDSSKQQQSATA